MVPEPSTDPDSPTMAAASTSTDEDEGSESMLDRQYFLVFEGESSLMHKLPWTGEMLIGRAKDVDLRLRNHAVSRHHARVTLIDGEAQVRDLGSQNGTRINGEKATEVRTLQPGDLITIGPATLAFHSGTAAIQTGCVIPFPELRQRLEEELDRSLRHDRDFGVLGIDLGVEEPVRADFELALARERRRLDVAAWVGSDELVMLLAETDAEESRLAAERLGQALAPMAPAIRVGHASCPLDGCDPDTLIARARTAALAAEPGRLGSPPRNVRTLTIGDRTMIIADAAMSRLYAMIERIAAVDLPVLICGETGTGKELAASAVHLRSPRRNKVMVTLNCAALQETLVESELFGHAKGAFSGAVAAKQGLFESASGGTVFLDEIGELSVAIQAKLLRVLETKRITRVGEVHERNADVRLVGATNRDLKEEVALGHFRRDLFYRLSGATLSVPPLRDRAVELPLLAEAFLGEACTRAARPAMAISGQALALLAGYHWPGNVRELKNLMDYVAAAFADSVLKPHHIEDRLDQRPTAARALPPSPAETTTELPSLAEEVRDLEIRRINQALEQTGGNQTHAAKLIGMPVRTFFAKVKRYGLSPGDA